MTRKDAGDPPSSARRCLQKADESQSTVTASHFGVYTGLGPRENKVLPPLLKPDEATPSDEIVQRLESEVLFSQIFTALFELELAARSSRGRGRILQERLLFAFF